MTRCPKCGVLLPLHVAGCSELRPPLSDAEFDPLFETEQEHDDEPRGLDAVSRPPFEVLP